MGILILSDLHHFDRVRDSCICESFRYIRKVVFLGDIAYQSLKLFTNDNEFGVTFYAVYGNHCEYSMFDELGIIQLDGKLIDVGDDETGSVFITGMSGSHRYKNGDYPMLTQDESIQIAETLPKADIFFTHDCAYGGGLTRKDDVANQGLMGIRRYIRKNKPLIHVHGHYHRWHKEKIGRTLSVGSEHETILWLGDNFRKTKAFDVEYAN